MDRTVLRDELRAAKRGTSSSTQRVMMPCDQCSMAPKRAPSKPIAFLGSRPFYMASSSRGGRARRCGWSRRRDRRCRSSRRRSRPYRAAASSCSAAPASGCWGRAPWGTAGSARGCGRSSPGARRRRLVRRDEVHHALLIVLAPATPVAALADPAHHFLFGR